ncbi:MAG: hypothetical protein ACLFQB_03165 [Chitinispirillaceae bacterium]
MKRSGRSLILVLSLVMMAASLVFARSIIERKIWYVDVNQKVKQARFWTVFLGNHDVKLVREFPGEGEQTIDASLNFQLLSSGYIEGNGYSSRGKASSLPGMMMINDEGEFKIEIDSIDYIYDFGMKVSLKNGKKGEFFINVEGTPKMPKKFLLREFKLKDYYGEEILKQGSEDKPIIAFSFTKEGAQKAAKEPISE